MASILCPLLPVCWSWTQEFLSQRRLMGFTAGVRTPLSGPERHPRLAERMLARRWQAHTGLQGQSVSPRRSSSFHMSLSTHGGPFVTQAPGGPWKSRTAVNHVSAEKGSELRGAGSGPSSGLLGPCPRTSVAECPPFLAGTGGTIHPATESLSVNWGQLGAGLVGLHRAERRKCL